MHPFFRLPFCYLIFILFLFAYICYIHFPLFIVLSSFFFLFYSFFLIFHFIPSVFLSLVIFFCQQVYLMFNGENFKLYRTLLRQLNYFFYACICVASSEYLLFIYLCIVTRKLQLSPTPIAHSMTQAVSKCIGI